jgi:hypothetical protein
MPSTDRIQRNKVQRDYVARNRERIYAANRKPVHVNCKHCDEPFIATPPNRKYCIICAPPYDGYAKNILRNFNLSRPEWNAMFAAQGGICAIDGCENAAKAVDHDHATGKVRALLCVSCNVFVGWYENTERVTAAMSYLERFS